MLYNAARVYAQAAREVPARGPAAQYEGQAVELLGQALAREPPGERAAFWRDYVQADRAFATIRQGSGMRALAATVGAGP
jgi:hypothetical protein